MKLHPQSPPFTIPVAYLQAVLSVQLAALAGTLCYHPHTLQLPVTHSPTPSYTLSHYHPHTTPLPATHPPPFQSLSHTPPLPVIHSPTNIHTLPLSQPLTPTPCCTLAHSQLYTPQCTTINTPLPVTHSPTLINTLILPATHSPTPGHTLPHS